MSEKEFVSGLYAKRRENAPDFVICSLSAKREDLIRFLEGKNTEWVNMQVLKSKDGEKLYVEVDNWKKEESVSTPEERASVAEAKANPKPTEESGIEYPIDEVNPEDIPF